MLGPNYGMAIIEAFITIFVLYYTINIVNYLFHIESNIPKRINKISSALSSLILLGIILGIRFIFEPLESSLVYSGFLSRIFFFFLFYAITISIVYPFYKVVLRKVSKSHSLVYKDFPSSHFRRRLIIIIGLTWVITFIFLSFDLLKIELIWDIEEPEYDIFYNVVFQALIVVFFNIIITYLFNMFKSVEKRLPKEELKNSMFASGIIAFGFWALQLIIFEMYLSRVFGLVLIIQDIRVLIIVVTGIYIITFRYLLKAKFLPKAALKSEKKIQLILKKEKERLVQMSALAEENVLSDLEELNTNFDKKESITYSLEGVSLKIYFYFLKKINYTHSFSEKVLKEKKFRSFVSKTIFGILWVLVVAIVSINLSQILTNLYPLLDMFFLGVQWAFFMTLIDISLTILFNRIIPIEKRIPRKLFWKSIFIGGIISIWMWVIPFSIIYSYLFIWISELFILNITQIAIISIIALILKIKVIRWFAKTKNWIITYRKTVIVSFFSLIIDIAIILLLNPFLGAPLRDSISLLIIFIGIILVTLIIVAVSIKLIFNKKFRESLLFIVSIQIILFLFTLIIGQIINFLQGVITTYQFNVQDIRIPFVVVTGIYLFSFYLSSKIKFLPEVLEEIVKEIPIISQFVEEKPVQEKKIEEKKVILDVQELTTYFYTEEGVVRAVEGVSFKLFEGEVLGLVGETGCGKSVTALSILRVVRPPGKIEKGKVIFGDEDLLKKRESEIIKSRGKDITMIFQDPLNSLNPVFKIGVQISEVYLLHMENKLLIEAAERPNESIFSIAREWSEQLLRDLNIPFPKMIFDRYPHELSGGMRQRVQIAMALACSPKLLIADEPTTALDVTIQNQILKLMKDLKKKYNTSILFITHDLGIISKMCDRVAVMYSGFIVEYGDIHKLFKTPYHPYTKGLIQSIPIVGKKKLRLDVIPGMVPNLIYPPSGCRFHPRCEFCFKPCDTKVPKSIEVEPNYFVACHLYDPTYKNLVKNNN